jgi:hypothetical protein
MGFPQVLEFSENTLDALTKHTCDQRSHQLDSGSLEKDSPL